jgi:hypothetical protein
LRAEVGDDALNEVLNLPLARDFGDDVARFERGDLSEEQASVVTDKNQERLEALSLDDPGAVMGIRAENDAADHGLSLTAQGLASDAMRAAADGLSAQDWTRKVLRHYPNASKQEEMAGQIQQLRIHGVWPWPGE